MTVADRGIVFKLEENVMRSKDPEMMKEIIRFVDNYYLSVEMNVFRTLCELR